MGNLMGLLWRDGHAGYEYNLGPLFDAEGMCKSRPREIDRTFGPDERQKNTRRGQTFFRAKKRVRLLGLQVQTPDKHALADLDGDRGNETRRCRHAHVDPLSRCMCAIYLCVGTSIGFAKAQMVVVCTFVDPRLRNTTVRLGSLSPVVMCATAATAKCRNGFPSCLSLKQTCVQERARGTTC